MTPYHLSLLSLVLTAIGTAYNLFFVPSRADRKDLEKRLARLELDDANHEARLLAFAQQLERLTDDANRRFGVIEAHLGEVTRMREDMAAIKAEMKHVVEGYSRLSNKIDSILDLLRR